MSVFHYVGRTEGLVKIQDVFLFHNKASFYGEDLLAPRPTSNLDNHSFSAVRDYLFNILPATLHLGSRSSCNLRTRHAVVLGPTYNGRLW